jgi:hypothetical protein
MKRWSMVLFAIGFLAGLILISLTTWAGQEAAFFEPTSSYDKGLSSLHCPLMIANDQDSSISVTLNNPSTYPVSPLTKAHITSGFVLLIDEYTATPSIPPGGSTTISWPIKPTDAAYKSLVLSRVFVERSYPLPSRTGSCGVLVLPFRGIPGQAVVTALVLICLIGMGLGLFFWRRENRHPSSRQAEFLSGMIALAVITCVGLLSTIINFWLLGLASVILVLLISIGLASRYWGEI